nr:RidA family protein [Kibdelosporangium sp. MJ126-NF4]CEL13011.1 Bona fide RidA/YjgF/TdcF/RutC subgroup [Kibdelosporangium sp. MJ126-NF4]CTQ98697.1 Bona fide RidA/YjgF/TdcF/RutC subgroup [Kibdelosporangium sp. MJ126-NF4]
MPSRTLVSSGSLTEKTFGYSRAVRVGAYVSVAGTTAMGQDGPVGGADIAAQTRECLQRAADALDQAGVSVTDVVRTRVFVTDITTWREVGAVHQEFFAEVLPATTIVEVSALFDPRLLVEIEVDAIATSG